MVVDLESSFSIKLSFVLLRSLDQLRLEEIRRELLNDKESAPRMFVKNEKQGLALW